MDLVELLASNDGVLDTATALRYMTLDALKWKVRSGRWQRPAHGIVVAQSGPATEKQMLRIAALWAGPRSVIGGLTAACLEGFKGFGDTRPLTERPVYLIVPRGRNAKEPLPGINTVTHQSRTLRADDIHPAREPPRTRIARSLVDAAEWMPSDRGAIAVLAAGVQQRLVRAEDLTSVVMRCTRLGRRALIVAALGDIAGGAQALSEIDFTRQVVRRFRLPEPDRQVGRRDERGRRRWIDVAWERWKVMAEIDGAQHMDVWEYWDDMDRDNSLSVDGYRTLRFPAWVVRRFPDAVARKIRQALRASGCRC